MYHKYYTKMHITHLRLIAVVDINLARAIHWTRWGLTRSSPLKVDVIKLQISSSEAVIYIILIL